MSGNEEQRADWQALVRRWIAAFNAHDVVALVALYAEDAELLDSGMKQVRHGRVAIEQWFGRRFASMPSILYTPTSQTLIGQGQAAVTWTAQGRSPHLLGQAWLSRPYRVDGVSVFMLCDGVIARQRGYYDHLAVVEQVLPPLKWLLPSRV